MKSFRIHSIRSRLLVWQITALLFTGLLTGVMAYEFAQRGFNQVRDHGLRQIAQSVLRHDETPVPQGLTDKAANTNEESGPTGSDTDAIDIDDSEPDEGQFISQIWSPAGELIYTSHADNGPPLMGVGYHNVDWQGQTWRTFTDQRPTRIVQVAVSVADREQHFSQLAPWVLLPVFALTLLLGIAISKVVTMALGPLERLRNDIGNRRTDQLHALEPAGLPDELLPLVRTINELLRQTERLLANQRNFLADAAHELNTPLAAIQLQVQLARRASPDERETALNELEAGVKRASRLATQLLQLARLEPDAIQHEWTRVDLAELTRQAVITFSARAEQLGIDLGLTHCDAVSRFADEHALRALLDNLIDNALRYCPRGSLVDVTLTNEGQQACWTVSDNGPGIAEHQREHALERFVRLSGTGTTGSGLGLAIVKEIALRHNGQVSLGESSGGGLNVRVCLPNTGPLTQNPAESLHRPDT